MLIFKVNYFWKYFIFAIKDDQDLDKDMSEFTAHIFVEEKGFCFFFLLCFYLFVCLFGFLGFFSWADKWTVDL